MQLVTYIQQARIKVGYEQWLFLFLNMKYDMDAVFIWIMLCGKLISVIVIELLLIVGVDIGMHLYPCIVLGNHMYDRLERA